MYIVNSAGCSKDYIELYVSNILVSERRLPGYSTFIFYGIQTSEGRFCNDRNYTLNINTPYDFMTVYFHTDGSGSGVRGLNVSFTAVGKYLILNNHSACSFMHGYS